MKERKLSLLRGNEKGVGRSIRGVHFHLIAIKWRWFPPLTPSNHPLNRGLNLLVKNGLQMLCKEGKTFSSFV